MLFSLTANLAILILNIAFWGAGASFILYASAVMLLPLMLIEMRSMYLRLHVIGLLIHVLLLLLIAAELLATAEIAVAESFDFSPEVLGPLFEGKVLGLTLIFVCSLGIGRAASGVTSLPMPRNNLKSALVLQSSSLSYAQAVFLVSLTLLTFVVAHRVFYISPLWEHGYGEAKIAYRDPALEKWAALILTGMQLLSAATSEILLKSRARRLFYVLLYGCAAIALSYGNRGAALSQLAIAVLLPRLYGEISVPSPSRAVIFAIFGLLSMQALTVVRAKMAYGSMADTVEMVWLSIVDPTFALDVLPLVGQSISHISAHIYLYDGGIPSGFLPYLSGLLGFLPRPLLEITGLPVGLQYSHPWMLAEFVRHMGGSFIFSEAYWFGGWSGCIVFSFITGIVVSRIDYTFEQRRSERKICIHYLIGGFLVVIGIGYGFGVFVKAIYLIVMAEVLVSYLYRERSVSK